MSVVVNYRDRMLADGTDKGEWMRVRSTGITATDVARLSSPSAIPQAAREKLFGSSFTGNAYTRHGQEREPIIAAWVCEKFGIESNQGLFHAEADRRHLATPDGIGELDAGLALAEIKTSGKPLDEIPANYMRQIHWQQYVLGAERTLFVWEQHQDFVPMGSEPRFTWIERDEESIADVLRRAAALIAEIIRLRDSAA
jgi:hypothetical protein